MISVQITGKNVSDDFTGPSMVYSHAQSVLCEERELPRSLGMSSTRVVYPHGQRASSKVRGTRIDSNETRSRSVGRATAPSVSSSRFDRKQSPVSGQLRNHTSTIVPPYNKKSESKQDSARIVDERNNVENEIKRNAESAMRHKSEKAQV